MKKIMFFVMALVAASTFVSCNGFAEKSENADTTAVDTCDTVQVDSLNADSVVVDSVVKK